MGTKKIGNWKIKETNYGNITKINDIRIMSFEEFGGDFENTHYSFDEDKCKKLNIKYRFVYDDEITSEVIKTLEKEGNTILGTTKSGYSTCNFRTPQCDSTPLDVILYIYNIFRNKNQKRYEIL